LIITAAAALKHPHHTTNIIINVLLNVKRVRKKLNVFLVRFDYYYFCWRKNLKIKKEFFLYVWN